MSKLSDARGVRRVTAAIGLVGFSVLLVVQDVADSSAGAGFYDTAVAHPSQMTVSALILLVSAILTVPAIGAIIHQARDRGATLAHLGALFTLLGAMGHMGLTTVELVMRSLAGGDPAQMRAFEDRLNADPPIMLFFVLLSSFGIGLTLLAWAAWRAGLIGWWGPALITTVAVAHMVLPEDLPAVVSLVALSAIAVVFGWLGIRTLRLSNADWEGAAAVPARVSV
ncbi:hypothetical protein J5X84_36900 [Streptosporangiaceae bacterium NEAU-GS5]|nr:hypothetical protein [Streptosporangiaceae bacterium NEAU-GS5]